MNKTPTNKLLFFTTEILLFSCLVKSSFNQKGDDFIQLSDKSATPKTVALYSNMADLASDKILVGHQDALAYEIGWRTETFRSDIIS